METLSPVEAALSIQSPRSNAYQIQVKSEVSELLLKHNVKTSQEMQSVVLLTKVLLHRVNIDKFKVVLKGIPQTSVRSILQLHKACNVCNKISL